MIYPDFPCRLNVHLRSDNDVAYIPWEIRNGDWMFWYCGGVCALVISYRLSRNHVKAGHNFGQLP